MLLAEMTATILDVLYATLLDPSTSNVSGSLRRLASMQTHQRPAFIAELSDSLRYAVSLPCH